MVEYYPISARSQARLHQFGKGGSYQVSFWDMPWSRAEFGKEIFWLLTLKNWKFGCIGNLSPEIECKRSLDNSQNREFVFSVTDGTAKLLGRDNEFQEPTPRREQTVKRERESFSGDSQGEAEESQPTEARDDIEARREFWSILGDFIFRHHIEPRVQ